MLDWGLSWNMNLRIISALTHPGRMPHSHRGGGPGSVHILLGWVSVPTGGEADNYELDKVFWGPDGKGLCPMVQIYPLHLLDLDMSLACLSIGILRDWTYWPLPLIF